MCLITLSIYKTIQQLFMIYALPIVPAACSDVTTTERLMICWHSQNLLPTKPLFSPCMMVHYLCILFPCTVMVGCESSVLVGLLMKITACHHRYHPSHNYSVHKSSSRRTYYAGIPDIIQAVQHFVLESALIELFTNSKVFGWCVLALGTYVASH